MERNSFRAVKNTIVRKTAAIFKRALIVVLCTGLLSGMTLTYLPPLKVEAAIAENNTFPVNYYFTGLTQSSNLSSSGKQTIYFSDISRCVKSADNLKKFAKLSNGTYSWIKYGVDAHPYATGEPSGEPIDDMSVLAGISVIAEGYKTVTFSGNGISTPSGTKTVDAEDYYTADTGKKNATYKYNSQIIGPGSTFIPSKLFSNASSVTIRLYDDLTAFNPVISYEANGDIKYYHPNSSHVAENSDVTVTFEPAVAIGYNFNGWKCNGETISQVEFKKNGNYYVIFESGESAGPYPGAVRLTPAFTAKKYTVHFKDGEEEKSTMVLGGQTSKSLSTHSLSKAGKRFVGWKNNLTGKVYLPNDTISVLDIDDTVPDAFFTALWDDYYYPVNYQYKNGQPDVVKHFTLDTPVLTPAAPSYTPDRKNFNFKGWSVTNTFNDCLTQINPSILFGENGQQQKKYIYAMWSPVHNISYNLRGGTNPSDAAASFDEVTAVTLPAPTRTGYTFKGWSTSANANNIIASIPVGTTQDMVLYAVWEPILYPITYNGTGGATNNNPTSYTIEQTVTLSNPSKTGYNFSGWSPTDTIKNGSTGAKSFTASWTPTNYTITYHTNGGTNSASNPASYTIESNKITLADPTRKGYTFEGWFCDEGFTSPAVEINNGSYGNRTFYAKWKINLYTITYANMAGAVNHADNPATYRVDTPDITFAAPQKTGYTFGGWYSDAACTQGNKIYGIPAESTGNVTVYAKWTVNVYYIDYENIKNRAGAVNHEDNPSTYTVEDAVTFKAPARTGYDFTGWFQEYELVNNTTGIEKGTIGNQIVYAGWTPIIYNINYHNIEDICFDPENPTTYSIQDDNIIFYPPERRGYDFLGWYQDEALTVTSGDVQIPSGSYGDKDFYAKWDLLTYHIFYEDLEEADNRDNPSTYHVLTDSIVLEDAAKDGYTFLGWMENDSDPAKNILIPKGSIGDRTFRAVWEANPCVAVFDANGGTGNMADQEFYADDILALPKNGFTREGCTFAGWSLDKDADPWDIRIFDGAKVRNLSAKHGRTVTLYAIWVDNNSFETPTENDMEDNTSETSRTKPVASITYDLGDGELREDGNPSFYKNDQTGEITLVNPEKRGYEFTGWTGTDLDGLTMEVIIPAGAKGNRHYKAHYEGEIHRITFYTEYPSRLYHSENLECGTAVSAPNPAPSMEGYNFIGWSMGSSPFVAGHKIYCDEYWVANFIEEIRDDPDEEADPADIPGSESPSAEDPGSENPSPESPDSENPSPESPGSESPASEIPGSESPGAESLAPEIPVPEIPVPEIPVPEIPGAVAPGEEKPDIVYHDITMNYLSPACLPLTSTMKVEDGSVISVSAPEEPPERIFREWDNEDGSSHDFTQPVVEDMTINADYLKVHKLTASAAPVKNDSDRGSLYMVKGQKLTLGDTGYVSDDKTTVSVSKKGVVTARKAGMAAIDNGLNRYLVYVSSPKMAVKKIKLAVGDGRQLYLNDLDENLEVSWLSSKPAVAQVVNGYVYAVGKGTATITASINGIARKCAVTVTGKPVNPSRMEDGAELSMYPGQKLKPVFADGFKAKDSELLTGNEYVQFYSKTGTLLAIKQGRTTVTLKKNGVQKSFIVNIRPMLEKKDIYVEEGSTAKIAIPGVSASRIDWTITDAANTAVNSGDAGSSLTRSFGEKNSAIATVTKNKVHGVTAGDGVLRGEYKGVTYEINLHVYSTSLATDNNLAPALNRNGEPAADKYVLTIKPGASYVVNADRLREELLNWKSNQKSVAVANELGIITGVKEGAATVTAKVGKKIITIKVVVSDDAPITSVSGTFSYKRVKLTGGWSAFISRDGRYVYDYDDRALRNR